MTKTYELLTKRFPLLETCEKPAIWIVNGRWKKKLRAIKTGEFQSCHLSLVKPSSKSKSLQKDTWISSRRVYIVKALCQNIAWIQFVELRYRRFVDREKQIILTGIMHGQVDNCPHRSARLRKRKTAVIMLRALMRFNVPATVRVKEWKVFSNFLTKQHSSKLSDKVVTAKIQLTALELQDDVIADDRSDPFWQYIQKDKKQRERTAFYWFSRMFEWLTSNFATPAWIITTLFIHTITRKAAVLNASTSPTRSGAYRWPVFTANRNFHEELTENFDVRAGHGRTSVCCSRAGE